MATGTIPAQTVQVGEATSVDVSSYFSDPDGDALSYGTAPGAAVKVDLSAHFSDPDGDALVFAGATSNAAVATVSVAQSTLTVTAVGRGETTVTATASDPGGLEVGQSFRVTVRPNRFPETVGSIPDMRLGSPERLNVSTYFRDPDGDSLIYAVETSEAVIAFGYVRSDTILVIAPVAQGSAMVTVTASDPVGASAQQSLEVTVPNQAPYGVDSGGGDRRAGSANGSASGSVGERMPAGLSTSTSMCSSPAWLLRPTRGTSARIRQ